MSRKDVPGRSLNVKEVWLKKVKRFLETRGFTITSLAEQLELSRDTVSRFANGHPVDRQTFLNICHEISLDWQELSGVGSKRPFYDWGDAPNVSFFVGRTEELLTLEQLIIQDGYQIVGIYGIGGTGKTELTATYTKGKLQSNEESTRLRKAGIGKSELSAKVAQGEEVGEEFEYVIWRSLLGEPVVESILLDIVKFISNQEDYTLPGSMFEKVGKILGYLKQYRCLIILDNVDKILEEKSPTGEYKEEHQGYAELFRQIGEIPHKSCLLLNGREKPKTIPWLETRHKGRKRIFSMELGGLDVDEVKQLLRNSGEFHGSDEDWAELTTFYNGNPFALELAAAHIEEVYSSSITEYIKRQGKEFKQNQKRLFHSINQLLDEHFKRLSALEESLMYWFAINYEPVPLQTLKEDISPKSIEPDRLINSYHQEIPSTIQSLKRRHLLEIRGEDSNLFTLQPVLIEYTIERLIDKTGQEIKNREIKLLGSHALLKASSKDNIRRIQAELLLSSLYEKLFEILDGRKGTEVQIKQIISILQHGVSDLKAGYAAGNIINLLFQIYGEQPVKGYDFSGIAIRQADLQGKAIQEADFTNSVFINSSFTQTLGNVMSIAFSNDGKFLAASDTNQEISVWNFEDNELVRTFDAHTAWVRVVAFSPLDNNLLISGSEDFTVRLWDIQNNQCLKTLAGDIGLVLSVVQNPKTKLLASSGSNGRINFWDVETGECLKSWQAHTANFRVWSIAWSPDGQYLVSGSEDKTLKVWDNAGTLLKILAEHEGTIRAVAFSPDGQMIASGSEDSTIKLWSTLNYSCLKTLDRHKDKVYCLAFNPHDSNFLVSGSQDSTLIGWNLNSDEHFKVYIGHGDMISSVAFNPDGQTLSSGGSTIIKFWNIKEDQPIKTLRGYTDELWAVAFNPNGESLVSSSKNGRIRIWSTDDRKLVKTLEEHTNRSMSVAFSPNSQYFASASDDRTIKLWSAETKELIRTLGGHTNQVRAVAFSPTSKLIGSGSNDKTIKFWRVDTGECYKTLEGHESWVWSVAFSPDGKWFASGDNDGKIRIWDVESGDCLNVLEGHESWVRSVAFNPTDPHMLASGSNDKTARIWNVDTGECLKTLEGHENWVWSVAFSPDGKLLASGSDKPRLWDVGSGELLVTLMGHEKWVLAVAFSYDETPVLASGGNDETIKLWDIQTYECLETLRAPRPYEGINITRTQGLSQPEKATLKLLGAFED
ncbi:MAG: hypothetical protein KME07_06515 [Pegethrix bostrychoides GSE-TBD4-15B]|jgi:WD40 repeat protein/transcriptional regulator with XRE-family HTH domain|uniref:Uncharacterized protein n=1 Tax=Pegethrix bostrychoides GSE-TBD4-15B TaxID=2839662 RepID=A0A951P9E2_9CYAN|nr:hypothetical protein [Pegethrix bostrychoides GSE-TBD4-15B]